MISIGNRHFESIESAHEFLRDGGSDLRCPAGWILDPSITAYRKMNAADLLIWYADRLGLSDKPITREERVAEQLIDFFNWEKIELDDTLLTIITKLTR